MEDRNELARRQAAAISSTADFLAAFNAEVREQLAEVGRERRRKRRAVREKEPPTKKIKAEEPELVTKELPTECPTSGQVGAQEIALAQTRDRLEPFSDPLPAVQLTPGPSAAAPPSRGPSAPPRPVSGTSAVSDVSTPGTEPPPPSQAPFMTALDFSCSLPEAVAGTSAQQPPIPFPHSSLEGDSPSTSQARSREDPSSESPHMVPNAPEMPRLSPPPARPRHPPPDVLPMLPPEQLLPPLELPRPQGPQSSQAGTEQRPRAPVNRRMTEEEADPYAQMPASPWAPKAKPPKDFEHKLQAKLEQVKREKAPRKASCPMSAGQPQAGPLFTGEPASCSQAASSTPGLPTPPLFHSQTAGFQFQEPVQSSQQQAAPRHPPTLPTQPSRAGDPLASLEHRTEEILQSARSASVHRFIQEQSAAQKPSPQPPQPQPDFQSPYQPHHTAPTAGGQALRHQGPPQPAAQPQVRVQRQPRRKVVHSPAQIPDLRHEHYVRDYAASMERIAKVMWVTCGCDGWCVRLDDGAGAAWVRCRLGGEETTQRAGYDPSVHGASTKTLEMLVLDHAETHAGFIPCHRCQRAHTKNLRQHCGHLLTQHANELKESDTVELEHNVSVMLLALRECFPKP